jgi:hypothetical protein
VAGEVMDSKEAPSAPNSSAATAWSMDCRSVSAAECVCDCDEGVQCPKERKPIFFMRAINRYPSLFPTVVVLSAATTII